MTLEASFSEALEDVSPRGPGSPPRVVCVVGWGAGQNDTALAKRSRARLCLSGGLTRSFAALPEKTS